MFTQRIRLKCLHQLVSRNKGRLSHTAREIPAQYDVSEKVRKLFEAKQKQREATKAYFQKIVMNPYRPKEDTVPFDPVLFRYNAFMIYHDEYCTPNLKNTAAFLACYVMPIVLLSWFFYYTKTKNENQLRAGEIAYKDRNCRGIL